ncbi:NUDIX hydrolase [Candidatus Woesearchaeota archaeon]|nr:NUDIX hydrolase [Candidatus Woesearchaeota archaeon]
MKDHAALLIRDDNKFLFVRRSMNKKTLPGIWAFPSGTREEFEDVFETCVREALEELGVKIKVEKIIGVKELNEFKVRLHFIVCNILEGNVCINDPNEFDKLEWLSFNEFFDKYSDSEIGHGLVFLRQNPELWKEYSIIR